MARNGAVDARPGIRSIISAETLLDRMDYPPHARSQRIIMHDRIMLRAQEGEAEDLLWLVIAIKNKLADG